MRRARKTSLASASGVVVGTSAGATRSSLTPAANWRSILGAGKKHRQAKLKDRDLVFILRNLSTLTQSGVSLPKALATLAEEKALEKHRDMLHAIRRHLESGETFSSALARYGTTFDAVMVNQIKVGEHSGTLGDTLTSIARHCEDAHRLQSEIVKKLAYPILLVVMGVLVITFLLTYVIPVFKKTYDDAHVTLPFITKVFITLGAFTKGYGLIIVGLLAVAFAAVRQLRKRTDFAYKMDAAILRAPIFGHWLRDVAVLQLMEVLGSLMDAGYNLAEALGEAGQAVGNRAIRQSVRDLQNAIRRGEKFSRELERHGDMFPPIVSQLVIVGEQTGTLARATSHIRDHLQREIERKTNIFVGTIEPTLTISLAAAIAAILLAIYLPMFDMVNTVK
ncbi:MAG TPA: type II secretion system F family protein [Lacipirellulaceae bacterium]|jgi:type IV pilus assembly protein PilC|nr:type II secretion system F family protein [Lacipirellulaceae bacterium]